MTTKVYKYWIELDEGERDMIPLLLDAVNGHYSGIETCDYCGNRYVDIFYLGFCERESCHIAHGEKKRAERDKEKAMAATTKEARDNRQVAPEAVAEKKVRVSDPRVFSGGDKRRPGHVYLVGSDHGTYKIGITINLDNRFTGLQAQSPVPLRLIHSFASNYYRKAERALHDKYAGVRAHGEWFGLSPAQIKEICEISDYGLDEDL